MLDSLFPRKIAEGEWFCDRVAERQYLKENIRKGHHSLIISPRRYGKTSLAFQTLHELKLPFGYTQFLNAYQAETIVKRLAHCISELLTQIESPTQKALKTMGEFFSRAKLSLRVSGVSMSFELEPVIKDPETLIQNLLEGLEDLLRARKKHAVIFLDEFQDIAEADITLSFQSILRDFAQRTKHVSFLVSGSTRHLLEAMFLDRNKPFYKLFDKINLHRITEEDYSTFLQEKAKKKWRAALPDAILKEVFQYTECHAYYVNRLCDELWHCASIPTSQDLTEAWKSVLADEFDSIADDLSRLTKNQRIVLQVLAHAGFTKEPSSAEFLSQARMSHASVLLTLKALNKLDYIERTSLGYRLIDPAMQSVLCL